MSAFLKDTKPYFTESAELLFSTLSSTHGFLKKHLPSFSSASFIAVRAKVQTSGHGQFKRKWISPEGGLFVSFLLDLSTHHEVDTLAMVLASSILSTLAARGVYPKLKSPNDLMLKGSKLGGVLVEICERGRVNKAICSYGLNVNIEEKYLNGIDQPAISLSSATEEIWQLDDLYWEIKEQFQRDFRTFERYGYAPFANWEKAWKSA